MSDKKYDWIGERIIEKEEQLMDALHEQAKAKSEGREIPAPPPPQEPVPVDPAAEKAAFAEFLALIGNRDAGDADTQVPVLDAEAFAAESFTPTDADNPNPET